jgi:hypothetical protein
MSTQAKIAFEVARAIGVPAGLRVADSVQFTARQSPRKRRRIFDLARASPRLHAFAALVESGATVVRRGRF